MLCLNLCLMCGGITVFRSYSISRALNGWPQCAIGAYQDNCWGFWWSLTRRGVWFIELLFGFLCLLQFFICFILLISIYFLLELSCRMTYRLYKTSFRPLTQSNLDEIELLMRRSHNEDFNIVIHQVQIKPLGKSHPLCRLWCFPLVWPINDIDIARLENEFVKVYRDGDRAMYVSSYNNLDEVLHVSNNIRSSWCSIWHEANDKFDAIFQKISDLVHFADKLFYVWAGNHWLIAWWRHINKHHSLDKDWHISIDCIVVDPRNCTVVFLNAMNDISWWILAFCIFFLFHSYIVFVLVHGVSPR